jgi:hypothetical protein
VYKNPPAPPHPHGSQHRAPHGPIAWRAAHLQRLHSNRRAKLTLLHLPHAQSSAAPAAAMGVPAMGR